MGFEVSGLDEMTNALGQVQELYPKEIKKFMQSEGTKLKNRTLKTAKSNVKKKMGNYFKGIKRGKYYKYSGNGADSIRVYAGKPAHHGHLVEYGHKTKNGNRTKAYHTFKTSADAFESTYESDCDKFADKITEPLNKG
jgi:hypothetical protein|nr:MAG TPA: putative tail-component [Caudoviricetes sp.]